MPLPEDWRAFIESLNSNGVEYAVIGGVALATPLHHFGPDPKRRTRPAESRMLFWCVPEKPLTI